MGVIDERGEALGGVGELPVWRVIGIVGGVGDMSGDFLAEETLKVFIDKDSRLEGCNCC